jgi:hypothetical protein
MDHGVNDHKKAPKLLQDYTTSSINFAISEWLQWASDSRRRVVASIGYALTLERADGWLALPAIFRARLDERERAMLAYAALRSLDPDNAETVARSVLGGADGPLPTFLSPMDDARFWASVANRLELKAYTFAAFEAMDKRDQTAFLNHIANRQVAA